jgi:hypothetical protein
MIVPTPAMGARTIVSNCDLPGELARFQRPKTSPTIPAYRATTYWSSIFLAIPSHSTTPLRIPVCLRIIAYARRIKATINVAGERS